jgi:hypothetical protein
VPEGLDQRAAPPHAPERTACMVAEVAEVLRAEVGQLVVLPVPPDELDGIQLGGICRQPFEGDPAVLRVDELADEAAPVHGEAIPNDQQLARHMAQEVLQELDSLRAADRPGKEAEVKPASA